MEDKISVIIPVYNCEKFLKRCIDSVINQTYKNLEIIAINDGSTDSSLEILNDFLEKDDRIIVKNNENHGVSFTRNFGLNISTGKYFMFVDADDSLEECAIEILYRTLKEKNVDVVRGNYRLLNNEGKVILNGKLLDCMGNIIRSPKDEIGKFLYIKNNIPCYSVLLLIDSKYKVNFSEELSFMEDTVFYYDLLININSIVLIPDIIYNYYKNESSRVNKNENYERNIYQILKVNSILESKNIKYKDKLNCKHITIILSYLDKIYKISKKAYIQILNNLFKNETYISMLNNIDYSGWNKMTIFKIKLLKNKMYYILGFLFKLKK